ncbi:hypothetical protein CVIRNUC_002128 [Coccomyxa viridis]|uniref:NADH:ubiquinone reductase (non-electrogenic) n=1 Tax=Coccomyxa viridis TaxID=1274662 RepID=A0AAV1HWF2_9CHLO|nr:hypothetical protein CVIRNUC_002128 [Coccomyxa viridis]
MQLLRSTRLISRLGIGPLFPQNDTTVAALPAWALSSQPWRGVKTVPDSPVTTGRERLVILGSGWAAGRLLRDINSSLYDYTVISPRNHMVFTPLLASTCVGTLECRAVALSLTDIQPHLKDTWNKFFLADALAIDHDRKVVTCNNGSSEDNFEVAYDKLAIATGSQGSTFGIPGVEQRTHFLRDVANSSAIRKHLIENWNKANLPTVSQADRQRLLHVVIVGGGPTGVEFAGELSNFISSDLMRMDSTRARDIRVTIVEGMQLLGSFDARLREYAATKLHKQGVSLVKSMVKEVREGSLVLQNGDILPYGICVWSTGVGPTEFTTSLHFAKTARGRIAVDDHLRILVHSTRPEEHGPTTPGQVQHHHEESHEESSNAGFEPLKDIYALGDCCANVEGPLPSLAQVAEQQGKYLAKQLNREAQTQRATEQRPEWPAFQYHHLGSMALVGGSSAIVELGDANKPHLSMTGFKSWVAWRSAYLTRLGNMRNRFYVMFNWTLTMLLGRDMSSW